MIINKLKHRHRPFWGLVCLAVVALGHLYGYGPWFAHVQLPVGLQLLSDWLIPIWVFGIAWGIAGIAILVEAIRGRPGWAALGGIVTMVMLWGFFYLLGWGVGIAHGNASRTSFIPAMLYLGVGLYIWGNVPQEDDVDEPFVVSNVTIELEQDTRSLDET